MNLDDSFSLMNIQYAFCVLIQSKESLPNKKKDCEQILKRAVMAIVIAYSLVRKNSFFFFCFANLLFFA